MELRGDATAPALVPEAAAPAATRLHVIDDLQALGVLSQRWSRLGDGGVPMEHFIWSREAAEVFAGDRLRVFAGQREGPACALAPLLARCAVLRRLEALASQEPGEPFVAIHEGRGALRELSGA